MIVPMKKASIYALAEDRVELLKALQRRSLMMIIDDGISSVDNTNLQRSENALAKATEALSFAGRFAKKEPMLAKKAQMDYGELIEHNESDDSHAKIVLSIKEEIQDNENRIQALKSVNEQLSPWLKLDIILDNIKDTRFAKVRLGFFPERVTDSKDTIDNIGGSVTLFAACKTGVPALLVSHRDSDEDTISKAQEAGFTEITLPGSSTMTAAQLYKHNAQEISGCELKIEDLNQQAGKAAENIQALYRLRDREATEMVIDTVAFGSTDAVFFVTGWIRSDYENQLRKTIEGVTEYFFLEINDPADDENPPTVTKNNRFITQFETITDSFSRPGARDVLDPNPVMGLWYWLFFGMMMGDAGYGLLMLIFIGGYKYLSKSKVKLINVLFYSSFTTIFWGIMFGSYFGMSKNELSWLPPPALLSPLDNIMISMGICLGIGALHMFCGMIMKAIIDFRHGKPWDGIFDQVSWIVLIIGLPLLFVEPLHTVGLVMAITGAAVILFTAGRNSPKFFGKITGGLLGLYGVTSYLSDILSYARILALMLSGGIVAMVMNILGGMVMPGPGAGIVGIIVGAFFGLLIYIIGHIFNLVLALLSAYVHDSRLQYLEFFGKFYDGGGYAFSPLSPNTKYIELEDDICA